MDTGVPLRPCVCFEVEKIVGISSDGGYHVQWKPTWVSRYHLVGCEHLVQEFLQQQAEGEQRLLVSSTESHLNDIAHQDPEFASGHKNVRISHLTEMESRSNKADLQADVGIADTVNLHDEVHHVLEEVKVKVTESVGGVEAMEPNYLKPIANESKNGDIDDIINQEIGSAQIGKTDESVGGYPCDVENANEINQVEIHMKVEDEESSPFDSNFQDFPAECQESNSVGGVEAMEPNYLEPFANESKNGDIDEIINQEIGSARIGKKDESVGGHPCVVENANEINQVEIDMKVEEEESSPFDSIFRDFPAEYQESRPYPNVARRAEYNETNQEEHNTSSETIPYHEEADELGNVPYIEQHVEELSYSNATDSSCRTMCIENSNMTQSDISINVRERCQLLKMNTFVLNIERLNIQSQKMSMEESSDSTDYPRRNRKRACTASAKKFCKNNKKSLHKHQKMNSAGKHYVCEKCDASFLRWRYLTRHLMTVHSSKKPYTCNISGCKKRYSLKQYLTRHISTAHSNLKPYTCNVMGCKMRFARKDHCLRHIRRQHKEKIHAGLTALSQYTENVKDSSNHNISENLASQYEK